MAAFLILGILNLKNEHYEKFEKISCPNFNLSFYRL